MRRLVAFLILTIFCVTMTQWSIPAISAQPIPTASITPNNVPTPTATSVLTLVMTPSPASTGTPSTASPDFVQLALQITTIVANVLLSCAVIYGFKQWRAQLKGTTKYQIARKLVSLAFQFQVEFNSARLQRADPEELNESEKSRPFKDIEYDVRRRRLVPLRETLIELQATNWEAKSLLEDTSELIGLFERFYKQLSDAIEVYFHPTAATIGVPLDYLFPIVYATDNKDQLSSDLQDAVVKLADQMQKYLK
jgi:hypothetical protein